MANISRLRILTFTRFLAAVWVILFHNIHYIKLPETLSVLFSEILRNGNIAVVYFFVLSGFIMIVVYDKSVVHDKLLFWKKRIARIYPIYLFSLVMSILLCGNYNILTFKVLVVNLLTLQVFDWGAYNIINVPSWSIGEEFIFYFFFPFLAYIFYRLTTKQAAWILLLLMIIQTPAFYFNIAQQAFPLFVGYFQPFVFGLCFGVLYRKISKPASFEKYSVATLIFSILIFYILIANLRFNVFNGLPLFSFLSGTIILALAYLPDYSFIRKVFENKIMILLGDISYTMYIAQVAFLCIFSKFFSHISTTEVGLYILLLCLFSVVLHKYYEIPLKNLILAFNKKTKSTKN